ncbi:MAG: aminotransferase class V-fold PLP-dependent enzyme [Clostridiales bacterium]|nr:aminotransferase class V-fold PLP-dependent enzyme [Clostridiales bacterium]
MIYFDNSATTHIKPKSVLKAMMDGATIYSANPGRSGHSLSLKTCEKVFEVRQKLCNFLNADKPEHIIFTQNCTDALNLAILGTLQKGGHVICSCNDHNSLSRPLFEMQKKGLIELTVVTPKNQSLLCLDDIKPHIKPNTYLIAINHVSNVNGDQANIREIGEFCTQNCLLFLVDGAQSCGHIKIDMQRDYIDMLALAPHKALYAPQGIGVLAFGIRAKILPIRYGGTGTSSIQNYQPEEYPESLESGTIATPNILALGAGVDFVVENYEKINKKIDNLATYLLFELSNIKNVEIYTNVDNVKFGVIGFNILCYDSTEVVDILSEKYNILVRGGLHCAPLKHKQLNTINQGIVRVSLSYFNNFSECEYFVKVIKKISNEKLKMAN